MRVYRFVQVVFRMMVSTLARPRIEGLDNVPPERPMLVAANHLHWLDAPAVMAFLPFYATVYVAAKYGTHPILGPLFRHIGAIFVRRGRADRKALRQALRTLNGGGILVIAPEGRRSLTGALEKGRPGAAMLAWKTKAIILPVVAWNHENMFRSLGRGHRTEFHVVFGEPFYLPGMDEVKKPSHDQLAEWTDHIMHRLAEMLPPEYRGHYA